MQITVSRDADQLLTDVEGFESELVYGVITDSEMELISKRAFEMASSKNNLSFHFMEAVVEALQSMGLISENLPSDHGGELPAVYGDGHKHYMELDDALKYINTEYGIKINLTSDQLPVFLRRFDGWIDGCCQYSDLIDNAMFDAAVELGFVRRDEDL